MWIFVHDKLLKEALDFFPNSFSKMLKASLLEGGRIPDLPCISFHTASAQSVSDDRTEGGQSDTHTLAACNLVQGAVHQLNLFLPNRTLSITYQYNIGFLALMHATTNSLTAQKSTRSLAKQIVNLLCGLFYHALKENDESVKGKLIGMVIHCIIDSYAPAHTFRISISEMKFHKRVCHVRGQVAAISRIGDLIAKKLSQMDVDDVMRDSEIVKYFERHHESPEKYFKRNKAAIYTLAKHIQFFTYIQHQGQRIKCFKPRTLQKVNRHHSMNYMYIAFFQNISAGIGLKHTYLDRAWRDEFVNLHLEALADVTQVLTILLNSSNSSYRAMCEFYNLVSLRTFAVISSSKRNCPIK